MNFVSLKEGEGRREEEGGRREEGGGRRRKREVVDERRIEGSIQAGKESLTVIKSEEIHFYPKNDRATQKTKTFTSSSPRLTE